MVGGDRWKREEAVGRSRGQRWLTGSPEIGQREARGSLSAFVAALPIGGKAASAIPTKYSAHRSPAGAVAESAKLP